MTDQAIAPKAPRTRKAGSKSPADKKGPAKGQTQAAPTADGAAILAEVRETMGKQTQAAGATTDPAKPKRQRKPAGDKGAQQKGGDQGSAGSAGAGKIENAGQSGGDGEMRGGTKQVLITEVKMPGRGGRPQGAEEYPFGDLALSRREGTEIVGPSFFIPEADGPDSHLATARKRHKDVAFSSRSTMEKVDGVLTKGLRIWKEPKRK